MPLAPTDPVLTSLKESRLYRRGPLCRWRIRSNGTRCPCPTQSPTASPDSGDPMLTIARSVARTNTESHSLFPATLWAYGCRPALPTRFTHGFRPGTSAPDTFFENRANTECSQWPHWSRQPRIRQCPLKPCPAPRAAPEPVVHGSQTAPTILQLGPLCACSLEHSFVASAPLARRQTTLA